MGWQQHGNTFYFYLSEWKNGRSVQAYFGTGATAELAATAEALRRVQREIDARQWRQEQQRRAAAEALLFELCEQSDLLVRAALVAAGFRQHDRGAWRHKRVKQSSE